MPSGGSKHFHCSSPFKAVRAVGTFLRFGQFSVTAMKNKEKGEKMNNLKKQKFLETRNVKVQMSAGPCSL